MEYSSCFDFDATPLFHLQFGFRKMETRRRESKAQTPRMHRTETDIKKCMSQELDQGLGWVWQLLNFCSRCNNPVAHITSLHYMIICIYIYTYIHIISCLRIIWSHTLSCPCIHIHYIFYAFVDSFMVSVGVSCIDLWVRAPGSFPFSRDWQWHLWYLCSGPQWHW